MLLEEPTLGTTDDPVVPTAPQITTPPPSPALRQAQQYAHDDVFAPDGKKWKDKFHGAQGYLKQQEAAWLASKGGLEAQIDNLTGAIGERDASMASLQQQVKDLNETTSTIPALQEQIATLTTEAQKAHKYQIAMRYPQVLGLKVEEEVPAPDGEGEPTKRTVNPVLDLIESSGLDGVTLEMTLQRMVAAMGEPAKASPLAPSVPPTPQPAGDDKQAWIAKAKDAQRRVNLNEDPTQAWADFEEATAKIRELEVLEASK